jgi:hypothetical protein
MTDIMIVAYAAKNIAPSAGWLPLYSVNGYQYGDTYARTGYTQADALRLARQMADAEAQRYIGDWTVIVVTKPGDTA